MESCLKDTVDPLVDPLNLPNDYPNVQVQLYKIRRSRKDFEEWTFAPKKKKKKKVAQFLDEDEVPLSEHQRHVLLRDTSGDAQQSTKAPSKTTSSKSPTAKSIFVSNSVISEHVLPSQPSPYPSQNILISQPPSTNIIIP